MNSLEKLRSNQLKELQLLERGELFLKGEPLRQLWDSQDKLKKQHLQEFKQLLKEEGLFLNGWCPPHPTFFVRRSIYDRLGKFDLNYRIASDVDLMMRFLEKYKIKSRYINEVWVKMRMGGTTNKSLKNIWLQNIEILNSFDKNSLSLNLVRFFLYKIISRFFQFLKKQP